MSMPRITTRWLRYAGLLALVVALYILLDLAGVALYGRLADTGVGRALQRGPLTDDLHARARQLQAESAAREATLSATLHEDAFMAGHQLAVASQYLALGLVPGRLQEGPLMAAAQQIALHGGHAARVGLAGMQPLVARTLHQSSEFPRRIERDEGGHAARLGAQLAPRHAHLFKLGFHVGLHAYGLATGPTTDNAPDSARIEGHALMVGLAEPLWRPLALPPKASGEVRRDAYLAALEGLRRALREGRAFLPPAPR